MSSTSQLSLGRKASLSQLKGEWMKHNRGYIIQVSQNMEKPQARYFSVCYSAPKGLSEWNPAVEAGCCSAHLKAIGKSRDEMEIVSIDLNHTCGGDNNPDNKELKRNYCTRDIAYVSHIASAYEPTRSKESNTKQFIGITKNATGFDMKKGQAAAAIRKLSHDTLKRKLVSACSYLPSSMLMVRLTLRTHINLKVTYALGITLLKRQFKRCYVRLSMAGHFWDNASVEVFICDGTFTKLKGFHYIILIAVTFDANNQVIIPAFCIVDVENADNWVYFKELLEDDFPGAKVWMSDADEGTSSLRTKINAL